MKRLLFVLLFPFALQSGRLEDVNHEIEMKGKEIMALEGQIAMLPRGSRLIMTRQARIAELQSEIDMLNVEKGKLEKEGAAQEKKEAVRDVFSREKAAFERMSRWHGEPGAPRIGRPVVQLPKRGEFEIAREINWARINELGKEIMRLEGEIARISGEVSLLFAEGNEAGAFALSAEMAKLEDRLRTLDVERDILLRKLS